MQLRKPRRNKIRQTIATLAASLLAAREAGAADQSNPAAEPLHYETGGAAAPDLATHVDSGILFYQESGGRVRAIEPAVNATHNFGDDHVLNLGVVVDALTGASPNGAVPSTQPQTFFTPAKVKGATTPMTTTSGGATIFALPPSVGGPAYGREYTTPPNTTPLDHGFQDTRLAGNIGWAQPVGTTTQVSGNAAYSTERDFSAATFSGTVAQDLNSRNTTLSLAASVELDSSDPFGGNPTPLTPMSSELKSPTTHRTVTDFVAGLTQIMNRWWLVELNYSYGTAQGYNNVPYKIISVVDPVSGLPTENLYENRPDSRDRQSIYIGNKFHIDQNVVDASFRYFFDSWGITSETVDVNDRYAVNERLYLQPDVRWYHQTAASFYHYYLVSGQPLPEFASADTRLGTFDALTGGLKIGWVFSDTREISLRGEYYKQYGNGHPAGAIGQLGQQNLFPAVSAVDVLLGYSFSF